MKLGSPKVLLAAVLLAVAATASASAASATDNHAHPSGATTTSTVTDPPLATCRKIVKSEVKTAGKLTIATSSPALAPWFWQNNPANQKGYESAVAYHVATTLGFKVAQVTWYSEPYELSETAGTKSFDFDINEITYNAKLTTKVAFSSSYFNVNESLVALKSSAVVTKHTPAELRTYLYGDTKNSPGLAFIRSKIRPTHPPKVYASLALAIAALQAGKIDAMVIDTPTGQYVASQQLTGGDQVAQFHTRTNHYVLLLQKSSPLTGCANTAIQTIAKKGTLTALSKQYLSLYNKIPFINP
jgi:polar amino acid transport system substrate-binding protein